MFLTESLTESLIAEIALEEMEPEPAGVAAPEAGMLLHEPYLGWQPAPQASDDDPHQPSALQQFPKAEFMQVYPSLPPQEASGVGSLERVLIPLR